MRSRHEGIGQPAVGVAVALEVPVLEVERLVAVAGGLPGEGRGGETAGTERLPLQPALAWIVVAGRAADADVELDAGDVVVTEQLERLAAFFRFVAAGVGLGGRLQDLLPHFPVLLDRRLGFPPGLLVEFPPDFLHRRIVGRTVGKPQFRA